MTKDIEFRSDLKDLLEEGADDHEILQLCLEHAYNMWPHSFERWLQHKRRHGNYFVGETDPSAIRQEDQ